MVKLPKLVVFAGGFRRLTRLRIGDLVRIKLRAVRKGVWFKVLNRLERGVMDLTLKVTEKIRSKALAKAVYSIVKKLLAAMESNISLLMRKVGVPLAKKLSLIAQRWGNLLARKWMTDESFMKFLAVMHFNNSRFSMS